MRRAAGNRTLHVLPRRGVAPTWDARVRALAELASELRDDEAVLSTSRAAFGQRYGRLSVLADGHRADEPGLLVITDRRLVFVGEGGARLVLARDEIEAWSVDEVAGGRAELRALTAAGSLAIHDVSARLLDPVEQANVRSRRHVARARAARLAQPASALLPLVATALAVLVWTVSLASVDPTAIGDAGLVSALPTPAFLALGLVCVAFAVTLTGPNPLHRRLAFHVIGLVFMLYAAPYLIGGEASFNVAWRHAGIADFIAQHGSVDPDINAYFNWPGFFVLTVLGEELAGMSALELASWVPFLTNLLYLAPLLLIARAAGGDPRLPWAAAWIFYLSNWVYQDYLSPQGLTYVLYLALAGLLLGWIRDSRRPALVLSCFLLVLAVVPSHQLTPFAMLVAVAALALVRSNPIPALPALIGVLIVTWVVFAAGPYLSGNLETLKDDIGNLGATISSNVTERVDGSETHVMVTRTRLAMTALVWALAAAAAWWLLRRGERRLMRHAALAAAPFSLVVLQAYGGEILLRVYLFSLPFASVLLARLLLARRERGSWRSAGAVALASIVFAGAFLVTRYGNERVNLFSPGEIAAVERVYELAEPGALIVAPNPQLPWQSRGVGAYRFKTLDAEFGPEGDVRPEAPRLDTAIEAIVEHFAARSGYVVITRNNREYESLFGAAEWGTIGTLERTLEGSPRFRRVFDNGEGEVFAYVPGKERR